MYTAIGVVYYHILCSNIQGYGMYIHCVLCIQHRMTKMVRKYLSKKHVIQEEDLLEKIADSTDRSEQLNIHTN